MRNPFRSKVDLSEVTAYSQEVRQHVDLLSKMNDGDKELYDKMATQVEVMLLVNQRLLERVDS